jgi:hypothetical protein
MKLKALIFGALLLTLPALAQKTTTIRVAPLVASHPMEQEYADVMTAKLIAHLTSAGIAVVEGESDEDTDAVLKVTYSQRGPYLEGPVRLTDMHGRVIWADEIRSKPFTRSASTSFAETVAQKVEDFLFKQRAGK